MKSNYLLGISSLATLLLRVVNSFPVPIKGRSLVPNAARADDIDGVSILMRGQAQTLPLVKSTFLLLSNPVDYYTGMKNCWKMGEGGYIYVHGTEGANDLVDLLTSNAQANEEVQEFDQFWVFDALPGIHNRCLAVDKKTGRTDSVPCSTQLPTVCFNSVMRSVYVFRDDLHQIIVNASVGQIQGWRDQNAFRFLGIPYAEPPTGDRRFAKAFPKAPFNSDIWDATSYGHICPQMALLPDRHDQNSLLEALLAKIEDMASEDEDCLELNVYTPSLKSTKQKGLPVIVFVHGGGYSSFAGSTVLFEPGHMVARGGVVVVTLNYRLGFLGWFENQDTWNRTLVPGNQAIHDVILALQWVQSNIAAFGGDPSRVTVMGESTGAVTVRALLSAPSAWDLYQNVILESDPISLPFKPTAMASRETTYFMEALGCTSNDIGCARSIPIKDLIKAQLVAFDRALADNYWVTFGLVYRPVIDGNLIPADFAELVKQGQHNTKANIIWGTMHDEAGLYAVPLWHDPVPVSNASTALQVLYEKERVPLALNSGFFPLNATEPDSFRITATKFSTDFFWLCPLRYLSHQASQYKRTFHYRFNRGRDTPLVNDPFCGSKTDRWCHSLGLQPTFGSGDTVPGYFQIGDDARFARQVIDRFTSFAKTGDPNPKQGQVGYELQNPDVTSIQWVAHEGGSEGDRYNPTLDLNLESAMTFEAEADTCDWMESNFQFDFQYHDPAKYRSNTV